VLTVTLPKTTTPVPLIGEYVWTWNVQEVIDFLLSGLGTVCIGIDWLEQMMSTDADGCIYPRGQVVGGHAVCLDGVDLGPVGSGAEPVLFGTNSWGNDTWGFKGNNPKKPSKQAGGRFKIAASDLHPLLSPERYGEALAAIETPRRGALHE
jgi:hypothetical protein